MCLLMAASQHWTEQGRLHSNPGSFRHLRWELSASLRPTVARSMTPQILAFAICELPPFHLPQYDIQPNEETNTAPHMKNSVL